MDRHELDRRRFLQQTAGIGALSLLGAPASKGDAAVPQPEYGGPNVIIIRFGGGVRRKETIDEQHTYAPYFLHTLSKQGTLFTNMELSNLEGVETSHGEGTMYILTGKYNAFTNVSTNIFGERFESDVPTLFEYFRKAYSVPEHQTLIINHEDRSDEEFYSFSNHLGYGLDYRSNVLSLYRFKVYLLRRQLEEGNMSEDEIEEKRNKLKELESIDLRVTNADGQSAPITAFWDRWREFYGESGFVNPRGDALLTELSVRAIRELRPRLMMVNFNDPDYVHWGNPSHYTRGIATIDHGIQRIVEAVQLDEGYRDNTVFAIVPDCGRDSNPLMPVPYQHHFGSKGAHDIFGLFLGPGIAKGQVIDKLTDQSCIAATLGHVMNFETAHTEGPILEDVFA
jgi:hypothetical protein